MNSLVPEQFGFRKEIHTQNAAFHVVDILFKSINQRKHFGGIFCHLAKTSFYVNLELCLWPSFCKPQTLAFTCITV